MIISLGYRIKSSIATRFRISEINALEHKPMYMSDYIRQLDSVLTSSNRPQLEGSGSVSYAQALEKATAEYRKYQNNTLSLVEEAYNPRKSFNQVWRHQTPSLLQANSQFGGTELTHSLSYSFRTFAFRKLVTRKF